MDAQGNQKPEQSTPAPGSAAAPGSAPAPEGGAPGSSAGGDAPSDQPKAGDAQAVPTSAMLQELKDLIEAGRSRWRKLIMFEALGLSIAVPLIYLWLIFLLDDALHLPIWGRAIASLIFFGVAVWLVIRLYKHWQRAKFTEDEVALAIERHTPGGVQNRLINALQLARDGRPQTAKFSQAVIAENYTALKKVQLRESAESRPAVIRVVAAGIALVIGVAFFAAGPERFTTAASRIFMPFADIDPIYDTRLTVTPGDITAVAGDDVTITIKIDGFVPDELVVLADTGTEQTSERVSLAADAGEATYTFPSVRKSLAYAVRGGDYVSRYYQIRVPAELRLERVNAVLEYPEYTNLAPRPIETVTGDLEALIGTNARLTFQLNQPSTEASIRYRLNGHNGHAGSAAGDATDEGEVANTRTAKLKNLGPGRFATELAIKDITGYRIETPGEPAMISPWYAVRATADRSPELDLTGVDSGGMVMIDSVLPLRLSAKDDYGLKQVGLFYRVLEVEQTAAETTSTDSDGQQAAPAVTASRVEADETAIPESVATLGDTPAESAAFANVPWEMIETWQVPDESDSYSVGYDLPVALLNAIEGEEVELAIRGRDTNPANADRWTTGSSRVFTVSGAGVGLQLTYEQILQTENELTAHIKAQEKQVAAAEEWIDKLSPLSGMRWDEAKNIESLKAAMTSQAKNQAQLRTEAAVTARQMVEESGTLRMSVGMLADTELVRTIRILEKVADRENPQQMRATLSDAKLTQERIIRSLRDIREQYVLFREDWELTHMTPFVKMLAERQTSMATASGTYAELEADRLGEAQQQGAMRRQAKLVELSNLAQTAFTGMATKHEIVGQTLADSFGVAAKAFETSNVKRMMADAADLLGSGEWIRAQLPQEQAAEQLTAIHADLRQAQLIAAQEALAKLKQLQDSGLLSQQDIDQLLAGSGVLLVDYDPNQLVLEELVRIEKAARDAQNRENEKKEDKQTIYQLPENIDDILARRSDDKTQDPDSLSLASEPGGHQSFPNSSDLPGNESGTVIQPDFEDLVGDLLEEADDLRDEYDTYNMNTAWALNEPGDISKQAGDMNSTAAAAATGNQKPPSNNIGGASRSGRLGARAHGVSVGETSVNRRGRDQAQEGQQEVPDVEGEKQEIMSDDPMTDTSTGVGGKVVKGDQPNHFSTKNAGEWKDEMTDRLKDPEGTTLIVERQGKPLDARVAALLRDADSKQEQVIQRMKAVKKELDALYLPTDHLDDIMAELKANLEKLKDKPDEEVFRRQQQLLEELKGAVVVFGRPSSKYQQTLQREQVIEGRILDEPSSPTLPGYEEAVSRYYEKLSTQ